MKHVSEKGRRDKEERVGGVKIFNLEETGIRRMQINRDNSSGELIGRRANRNDVHATHVIVARGGPSGKNCLESPGLADPRQLTTSHGARGGGASHINRNH